MGRSKNGTRAANPDKGVRCPLISIWPDAKGVDGYMFPMKNGTGVGVMLNYFQFPEILENRSHAGWDDAYYTLLKNYQDNSKHLAPDAPEPKPVNARKLIGSIRDPERIAIITSCGPSLSKNLTYVYEARRRNLPVDVYGINRSPRAIRPDGHMLIERRRDGEWTQDRLGLPKFVLSLFNTSPDIINHYLQKGVPIYWGRGCLATEVETQDPREAAYPMMSVKGGTTLSCLLYFLIEMGYRKILLTGCDLSIETKFQVLQGDNGIEGSALAARMYFDRMFADTNYKVRPHYAGRYMMAIKGIAGEGVLVNNELIHFTGYIQAIEQLAHENRNTEIINCSEGGALWLPKMMPLREALGIEALDESRQKYNAMFAIDRYGNESWGAQALRDVLPLVRKYKPASLLDYGCGYGQLAYGLARECPEFQFYGVDISDVAIAVAQERAKQLKLDNVDFALAFDQPKFKPEAVTCFDVLEHLPGPSEAKALLKHIAPNIKKMKFITGVAASGKSLFTPSPCGDLHTCKLRPGEWRTLLLATAKELKMDAKVVIEGRRTSFLFTQKESK